MPGSIRVTTLPINTKRDVLWGNLMHTFQALAMTFVVAMLVFLIPVSGGNLSWWVIPFGSIVTGTMLYWQLDGIWRKHWYIVSRNGKPVEEMLASLPDK